MVDCTGNEPRLALCDGQHNPICSHSEDAGVRCKYNSFLVIFTIEFHLHEHFFSTI